MSANRTETERNDEPLVRAVIRFIGERGQAYGLHIPEGWEDWMYKAFAEQYGTYPVTQVAPQYERRVAWWRYPQLGWDVYINDPVRWPHLAGKVFKVTDVMDDNPHKKPEKGPCFLLHRLSHTEDITIHVCDGDTLTPVIYSGQPYPDFNTHLRREWSKPGEFTYRSLRKDHMIPEQYRKKPVTIRAIQYDGTTKRFEEIRTAFPKMVTDGPPYEDHCWQIATLEGWHTVTPGDFIVEGIEGEFYPVKPDIFQRTYEKVEA